MLSFWYVVYLWNLKSANGIYLVHYYTPRIRIGMSNEITVILFLAAVITKNKQPTTMWNGNIFLCSFQFITIMIINIYYSMAGANKRCCCASIFDAFHRGVLFLRNDGAEWSVCGVHGDEDGARGKPANGNCLMVPTAHSAWCVYVCVYDRRSFYVVLTSCQKP